MFSFSRNAFVVIDSDTFVNEFDKKIDRSNFKNAKQYIKNQFQLKIAEGYKLGIWYNEGNKNIRTIESYINETSKKPSLTKKMQAIKLTKGWGTSKRLNSFKNDLDKEVSNLYKLIEKWNTI